MAIVFLEKTPPLFFYKGGVRKERAERFYVNRFFSGGNHIFFDGT